MCGRLSDGAAKHSAGSGDGGGGCGQGGGEQDTEDEEEGDQWPPVCVCVCVCVGQYLWCFNGEAFEVYICKWRVGRLWQFILGQELINLNLSAI